MAVTYTKEDLERAVALFPNGLNNKVARTVAQLVADVRREERERCAKTHRSPVVFMHWLIILLACGGARVVQWTPYGYELQPDSHLSLIGFDE